MAYKYQAYTSDKKIVEGTLEAASESLAESALYRAGYQRILSLKEKTPGSSLEKLLPSLYGVKTQEVIDFSNQLATLVESGISLVASLELLGKQNLRKPLKKIIAGTVDEIQGGGSLSQALGHYPKAFSHTYVQTIKASEQAGHMERGLKQAAGYLEKQATVNRKIMHAMAYPIFILLMAAGVSVLLITVALPPLIRLFNSLGAVLPWMTRALIAVATFFLDSGLYVLAGLLLVILFCIFLLRLPSVKAARDSFILKTPVIGSIIIERSMQFICQTTAMLLQAGLRLPAIMDIIIETNRNRIIRQALSDVRDSLVQGEGLSRPLAENALFPPLLVEMTVVGEKTGALDSTLLTLADFYEKKISRRIDALVAMIEPALTVIVGLVVVFIALSMIVPMYSILRSMN
jgi:type IV pilus assembly protein PilC